MLSLIALVAAVAAGVLAVTAPPARVKTIPAAIPVVEAVRCPDGLFMVGWTDELEPECGSPPSPAPLSLSAPTIEYSGCQIAAGQLSDPGPCLVHYFEEGG